MPNPKSRINELTSTGSILNAASVEIAQHVCLHLVGQFGKGSHAPKTLAFKALGDVDNLAHFDEHIADAALDACLDLVHSVI